MNKGSNAATNNHRINTSIPTFLSKFSFAAPANTSQAGAINPGSTVTANCASLTILSRTYPPSLSSHLLQRSSDHKSIQQTWREQKAEYSKGWSLAVRFNLWFLEFHFLILVSIEKSSQCSILVILSRIEEQYCSYEELKDTRLPSEW